MAPPELLTAEEFLAQRSELPDGGRWTELVAGRLVNLSPPTVEHGTAVLNLSKALAEFSQREKSGYACFELGLLVARNPDTVHFPAVSVFTAGPLFAEADKEITETRPQLVVDVASTNDRRRAIEERVTAWLAWGVEQIWILDPQARQVHFVERGKPAQRLSEHQTLFGHAALSGFRAVIGDLFKEPPWAR